MTSATTPASAASIAMDLAAAIHRGLIGPGQKIPSQAELMSAYGVAMATAAAAIAKVREAGMIRSEVGRGSFVVKDPGGDVGTLYLASLLCAQVASTTWPPGVPPTLPAWVPYEAGYDDDGHAGRHIDATALVGLDRSVARALADTFRARARQIVGHGAGPGDQTLIDAARAIVRDGGRRPDGQPGIALYGGADEDDGVVYRLWPHRADPPGPDDPPF
jgi:DNA-binding transcriptional MocR family regulator